MLQTETRERTEFGEDPEAAVADATPTGTPSLPAVCRELFFQRCLWCGTRKLSPTRDDAGFLVRRRRGVESVPRPVRAAGSVSRTTARRPAARRLPRWAPRAPRWMPATTRTN